MQSKTVLPIQDLAYAILLFGILCYVIKLYRAVMSWNGLLVENQQRRRVEERRQTDINWRRIIKTNRPNDHRRYPTENDEREG